MAEILRMIALSPTMSEGKILKWILEEGKAFSSGDVLCEVETDKASMDYEAPKSATLLKIVLAAGKTAKVGDPVAVIGAAGEDFSAVLAEAASSAAQEQVQVQPAAATAPAKTNAPAAPERAQTPAAAAPEELQVHTAPKAAPSSTHDLAQAAPLAPAATPPSSPLARKRALEAGVDIRLIRGSGPNGRVVEKDVEGFVEQGGKAPAAVSSTAALDIKAPSTLSARASNGFEAPTSAIGRVPPAMTEPGMKRQVIARRLSESFFSAPHYYLKKKISAVPLLALRAQANEGQPTKLSFNAFLMKIVASTIAQHPEVNVYWRRPATAGGAMPSSAGGAIPANAAAPAASVDMRPVLETRTNIDIALAVALPDGLITPVVRDCDRKTVREIDAELSALIEKAHAGRLSPDEYEGAGFTISNLGSFGIDEFTAIINPPGSAILAVGAVLREPVVNADGQLAVGQTLALTLGCDHRSIDGAVGAVFLADLAKLFENPGMALV